MGEDGGESYRCLELKMAGKSAAGLQHAVHRLSLFRLRTSCCVAEATKEAAIATKILQRQTQHFGGGPSGGNVVQGFCPKSSRLVRALVVSMLDAKKIRVWMLQASRPALSSSKATAREDSC